MQRLLVAVTFISTKRATDLVKLHIFRQCNIMEQYGQTCGQLLVTGLLALCLIALERMFKEM